MPGFTTTLFLVLRQFALHDYKIAQVESDESLLMKHQYRYFRL